MDQNQTIKVTTSNGVIKVDFYNTTESVVTPHIAISRNNTLIADVTNHTNYFPDVHPYSLNIWQRYQHVRRGNLVIRSGFGLCGCYENYSPNTPPNPRHQESDTEHASVCVELIRACQTYYPELLSPDLYLRAEHLLKDHDLGENNYGDQPDDGSQNRAEKDQAELISFVLATAYLPAHVRQTAISDFIYFQDPLFPNHPTEIAHLVQLAKIIDKFEAILSGAAYEKSGIAGDLRYKSLHYGALTKQDEHFIHETSGDSSLIAGWTAHAVHDYHMYYGFPYVIDIIKAAVIDIRGEWFPWFNEFCERNQIPKEHISHPSCHTNKPPTD